MKRRIIVSVLSAIFFLAAVIIMLYPAVSNYVNEKYPSEIHTAYIEQLHQTDKNELQLIKDLADAYNKSIVPEATETSVYKGYKQDKIEMRGDRAEMSDFPLYLNTVAGGLDRRDQTIGGFSFVVKIYAVPVVEIIG